MANPIDEQFVGVAHPLAQMHKLKPGVDGEGLEESPGVADVFVNAPGIGSVAFPACPSSSTAPTNSWRLAASTRYSTTTRTGPRLFSTWRGIVAARQCVAGEKSIPTPV